jgi:hypothetical protein
MTPEQDNKVEIPLDFSDAELLVLFKQAHEQDVTFNQFVEQALIKFLEQTKTEFLTKAVTEHLERQQNDNVLNKQDGSVASGLVQSTWPYPESN